ncbi:MAG: 3-phosphoshikimate 1-carboxyvinyltransferase [Pseudomonadota bacterium]
MIKIKTRKIKDTEVVVPGSKSLTHRVLICAALADGICTIRNDLKSEDTRFTLAALQQMGICVDVKQNSVVVNGKRGEFNPCKEAVYLGNSGTSMRLLTAVASLGKGTYTLTGTERMGQRPIQDLLDGMTRIGIRVRSAESNGCPPVQVEGGRVRGGKVALKCGTSSQFLSALLLIAPYTRRGLEIDIIEGPVSRPYVDLTLDVMANFGVPVFRDGYTHFRIEGDQAYSAGSYTVEPDCSQAGYFWAAAAITGAGIKVKGITRDSRQGDLRFAEVLSAMGCIVSYEQDGIAVKGRPLTAVTMDMADMPDMVPTLAVVGAFAKGTTEITNVPHLKAKESDRLGSVVTELTRMGIEAECSDTGMTVKGGKPRGAEIDTYEDHRIAMSFALAGLAVPGVFIKNEQCVEKSFPDFWEVFEGLYK